MGEKKTMNADDFYPQLSHSKKKKRHSNQLIDWNKTPRQVKGTIDRCRALY